jgi:PleD family two-component response regulator
MSTTHKISMQKPTIVCVDASQEALATYVDLLEPSGFTVFAVTGERSALRIIERNRVDVLLIADSVEYDPSALAAAVRAIESSIVIAVIEDSSLDTPFRFRGPADVVLQRAAVFSELVPHLRFLLPGLGLRTN